jgi:amino acid adenylation domain-containing protein
MRSVAAVPAHPDWAPAPGDSVLDWFGHWVAATPHATAVLDGAGDASYRELDARAEAISFALAPYVRPGAIVGVALPRGIATVAVALALARLRARYVPVGTQQPEVRLRLLGASSGMSLLVADESGGQPLAIPTATIDPAGQRVEIHAEATASAAAGEGDSNGIYGVFTSGSTGAAKLVLVDQASLQNLLRWYCRVYRFGPGQRVSLLVSTTFDVHLMEMWASLVSGSTLVVVSDEIRRDPEALLRCFDRDRVTIAFLPTPVAEVVDAQEWPASIALREIQVGGDKLTALPRPRPGVRWHNLYGPAEATVVTVAADLEDVRASGHIGPPPIGQPVDGTVVVVVDEGGAVVDRGSTGELWLGGECLSRGYALLPELNASRFLVSGCAYPETGGPVRFYRTGDLVAMRPDGTIDFLGRVDHQIKIRGVRIEPGEIESALRADPLVAQAAVVGTGDSSASGELVAFVAGAASPRYPSPEGFARHLDSSLRAVLPPYLTPDRIVVLPVLPQTENGKIDRAALVEIAAGPSDPPAAAEPAQDFRSMVWSIWRDELKVSNAAGESDFFACGGTSLVAVRIVTRLRDQLGVRVKLGRLMRERTFDGLVDQVAELHHAAGSGGPGGRPASPAGADAGGGGARPTASPGETRI